MVNGFLVALLVMLVMEAVRAWSSAAGWLPLWATIRLGLVLTAAVVLLLLR